MLYEGKQRCGCGQLRGVVGCGVKTGRAWKVSTALSMEGPVLACLASLGLAAIVLNVKLQHHPFLDSEEIL